MPVQINEVIIRAVVGSAANEKGSSITPGCGDDGDNSESASGTGGSSASNDIAEQILELIRAKQER